jgi:hypothetical protein
VSQGIAHEKFLDDFETVLGSVDTQISTVLTEAKDDDWEACYNTLDVLHRYLQRLQHKVEEDFPLQIPESQLGQLTMTMVTEMIFESLLEQADELDDAPSIDALRDYQERINEQIGELNPMSFHNEAVAQLEHAESDVREAMQLLEGGRVAYLRDEAVLGEKEEVRSRLRRILSDRAVVNKASKVVTAPVSQAMQREIKRQSVVALCKSGGVAIGFIAVLAGSVGLSVEPLHELAGLAHDGTEQTAVTTVALVALATALSLGLLRIYGEQREKFVADVEEAVKRRDSFLDDVNTLLEHTTL